jgi:hypothetical protein
MFPFTTTQAAISGRAKYFMVRARLTRFTRKGLQSQRTYRYQTIYRKDNATRVCSIILCTQVITQQNFQQKPSYSFPPLPHAAAAQSIFFSILFSISRPPSLTHTHTHTLQMSQKLNPLTNNLSSQFSIKNIYNA